jgi:hypothetical protein
MPSSGGTTGAPVSGGAGTGLSIAQPLTRTLLSLGRYAQIMGLNPAHFAGGFGQTIFPVDGCEDVWPRHSWQSADRLSHEELANTIHGVEEDIASILGYYPAPQWIAKEMHPYPSHYRPDAFGFGLNARGLYKSVIAKHGKFITAGQRGVSLVGTATTTGGSLSYTDEDGDGQVDTATITLATTLTDACEINTYFADQSGDPEWEIRPARSKTISGGNVVLVYDSWLFIDPDIVSAYPTTAGFSGVDITTVANYVTSVDIYREYTDFTQQSAEFSWEPKPNNLLFTTFCTSCGGTGCVTCQNTIQNGCLHIRDVDRGILVPVPATYDATDARWEEDQWTECREPDTVKVWYYAGDLSERFLREVDCDPLAMHFAQAIAWMATARLERPPCGCNNIRSMFAALRRDLAFVGSGEGEGSYNVSFDELDNPFGTRRGEIQAWRRIRKLVERIPDFALV